MNDNPLNLFTQIMKNFDYLTKYIDRFHIFRGNHK